jgi:hypothetical protein
MYGIYANIGGILMGSMLPYIPYMDPMGKWILASTFGPQQPSFGPLEKSCWKVSLGYPGCPIILAAFLVLKLKSRTNRDDSPKIY